MSGRTDIPKGARPLAQNGYTIYLIGEGRRPFIRDAYHYFLRMPWALSLLSLAALFMAINICFAVTYLITGGVENAAPGSFFDALTFSVETMTTIGYGVQNPHSGAANVVMMLEAMTSIIITALATGLVFAKFSRSTARVSFSSTAVIGPHDGKTTLMFRVGNRRGNTIYDAQLRVACAKLVTLAEGDRFYKLFDLALVRDRQIGLKRGWTVIHTIDETSPLHGLDQAGLAAAEVEIQISLSGIDDTSMQVVTVVHEYSDNQIQFDRRFADTLTPLSGGDLLYDQSKFDETVPLSPRASVPA